MNRLILYLNRWSGYPFWRIVQVFGFVLMFVWILAALPWVGLFLGIDWLGSNADFVRDDVMREEFTIYGDWIQFSSRAADIYFFTVLLSVVFAKAGLLLFELGQNYIDGSHYLGHGIWRKR